MIRLLQQIKRGLLAFIHPKKEIEAAKAYDLWASTYDEQENNLIVYLDEIVFDEMISGINFKDKIVVDVGCGTGKHWKKMFEKKPQEVIGFEVSAEMLKKLHGKYPGTKAWLVHDEQLKQCGDESCDIIVSTLVIGYVENLFKVFTEWNRVLKKNGEIFFTDFHPEALQKGGSRSFKFNGQILYIKNYIHSLAEIVVLAQKMNWEQVNFVEKRVDASIRHFYEKYSSLEAYDRSFNTPILYGCHFRKGDHPLYVDGQKTDSKQMLLTK